MKQLQFNYKEILKALGGKLKSGKLDEQQKIKVFFYIKTEELKYMTISDLQRVQKRFESMSNAIDQTIIYLETRVPLKERRAKKLAARIRTERYAQRLCRALLKKIEKQLERRRLS